MWNPAAVLCSSLLTKCFSSFFFVVVHSFLCSFRNVNGNEWTFRIFAFDDVAISFRGNFFFRMHFNFCGLVFTWILMRHELLTHSCVDSHGWKRWVKLIWQHQENVGTFFPLSKLNSVYQNELVGKKNMGDFSLQSIWSSDPAGWSSSVFAYIYQAMVIVIILVHYECVLRDLSSLGDLLRFKG